MHSKSRWILGPALALALTGVPPMGAAAVATDAPRPTPTPGITVRHLGNTGTKLFDRVQSGPRGLRNLDAAAQQRAAAINHMSLSHLEAMLSHDSTVRLGTDGRIFYADTMKALPAQANATDSVRAAQWSTFPLSSALTLHSDPGSDHTIYLDFNGYTMPSQSYWSTPAAGLTANHTYGGFSLDATTTGAFSTAEEQYIQDVWRIVAEKYSPMDVDVTTEDPGQDAYNRTSATDTTYGTHVVITNDMTARPTGCDADLTGGCLGVGLLGVFNQNEQGIPDYLEPAWVFTKFTAADDVLPAGVIANDAAHEIGHTVGLDHDRISGQDYYPGHDDWFPIMGASDLAIGQFNNGGYPGYVSDQTDPDGVTIDGDDYHVMNLNGLPTRADDVSGTKALGSAANYLQNGVIETAADVDTYQVNRTCTNAMTATATGIGMGQSVDLQVTIKDPNGVVQATADPAASHLTPQTFPDTPTGMDASAQVASATTGLWTVSVEGVGLAGSAGYSDYGSVGQYNLSITGCTGSGGVAPDAPTGGSVELTARSTSATIHWAAPVNHGDSAITGYAISGTPFAVANPGAGATSAVLTHLVPGTTYDVQVAASN
ncbi:MAG: fibronectin type III domain-containing protein, partial [Marmoricola sp.]